MKRKTLSALVALAATPLFVEASSASVSFLYVGVPSPSSVTAGNSTSAEIYLQETLTGGSSDVITSNTGLFGAGVQLSITGHTGGSQATITNFNGDSAFDGSITPSFTNSTAGVTENIFVTDSMGPEGTASTVAGTTTRLVPLGLLNISTSAPGTTTFTVGEFLANGIAGGNTLDNGGNDYDSNSSNPAYTGVGTSTTTFVVTATAVPEPAAALGMIVLGGGLLLSRWRRSGVGALKA
jgi:hypothetical protein